MAFQICKAQNKYRDILFRSEAKPNLEGYVDSTSTVFRSVKFMGHAIHIKIDSVSYNKPDSTFLIVGQSITGNPKDSYTGYCCIRLFLAEVKADSLVNINVIAETNIHTDNPDRPDGYFRVKIRPRKGQRLFFASLAGEALHEFSLEGILKEARNAFL